MENCRQNTSMLISGFGDDFHLIDEFVDEIKILIRLQYKDCDFGLSLSVPIRSYYADSRVIGDCMPITRRSDGKWCISLLGDYKKLRSVEDARKITKMTDEGKFEEIWE